MLRRRHSNLEYISGWKGKQIVAYHSSISPYVELEYTATISRRRVPCDSITSEREWRSTSGSGARAVQLRLVARFGKCSKVRKYGLRDNDT